jgi:hypothetical protein
MMNQNGLEKEQRIYKIREAIKRIRILENLLQDQVQLG